jgi:hypothetical protein
MKQKFSLSKFKVTIILRRADGNDTALGIGDRRPVTSDRRWKKLASVECGG